MKNAYLCSTNNVCLSQFNLKPNSPACECRGFFSSLLLVFCVLFIQAINNAENPEIVWRFRAFCLPLPTLKLRCVTASTKGEKMIQAPTLLERWAYFYAHTIRWREAACRPSLMRKKYGGCLPRVFDPSGCEASEF